MKGDVEASWRKRLATYGAVALTAIAPLVLALDAWQHAGGMFVVGLTAALAALIGTVIVARRFAEMRDAHVELQAARATLHRQTLRDPLTGLLNRFAFHGELERLAAGPSRSIAILYFDLDRFKDVNDTMGHRTGDALLVQMAERCEAILADATIFARLGGDEFAAVIPVGARAPESYGKAIVKALAESFDIDGKVVNVGASVGIAVGDLSIDDHDLLIRRADTAMYAAKGSTNGAVRMFDDVLDDRQAMESSIRIELGRSAIQQELNLVYQPILDARTGRVASLEALLRWNSGKLGQIAPATLIPVAEESGHIIELTDWTLDVAIQALQKIDDIGVSVNISPIYFRHPEFAHRLFDRMLAARIKPERLTVEITEGVLIANLALAKSAIGRLRDIGVKVYLDDFGTGYSSLSYLQHFALDGLKLDKSFLREVGEKRQTTQIVRSMIDFGHSLDMRVVMEGVENDWQVRLLQLLGCDLLQGYELAAPMPLDDAIAFAQEAAVSSALRDLQDPVPLPFGDAAVLGEGSTVHKGRMSA